MVKLRISLVNRRETLHAIFYVYELEFVPSGESVTISYVEIDPQGSNIFDDPKSPKSDVCELSFATSEL